MSKKITFGELTNLVSQKTGIGNKLSHEALKSIGNIIENGLASDGHVFLKGLGSFSLKWVPEHEGRNPKSGDIVVVEGYNKIVFHPDTILKSSVNQQFQKEEDIEQILPEDKLESEQEIEVVTKKKPMFDRNKWIAGAVVVAIVAFAGLYTIFQPETIEEIVDTSVAASAPVETIAETEPPIEATVAEKEQTVTEPIEEEQIESQSGEAVEAVAISLEKSLPETAVEALTPKKIIPPKIYKVKPGDNLWKIAKEIYGDPLLWPVIYYSNVDLLNNPDMVKVNARLSIPSLKGLPENRRELNRPLLADSYMQVYLAYSNQGNNQADQYLFVAKKLDPSVIERFEPFQPVSIAP